MENEHVLASLIRKRAEIAGELEAAQSCVRQLVLDVNHVDATIRLFASDMDLEAVPVRPVPARHAAMPGQVTRPVLDALRNTTGAMTTRDLAFHVMRGRGLNVEDVQLVRLMVRRVGSTLRQLRDRGALEATKGAGGVMSWRLG